MRVAARLGSCETLKQGMEDVAGNALVAAYEFFHSFVDLLSRQWGEGGGNNQGLINASLMNY